MTKPKSADKLDGGNVLADLRKAYTSERTDIPADIRRLLTRAAARIDEQFFLAALPETGTHTDHPLRHFDRTCPACTQGDTPRTDARWNELYDQGGNTITWFEVAERVRDFARQLERKLASKTRDADHFFQLSGRYLEELNALQSAKPLISPGVINDYQALAEKAIERIADHHDDTTEALLVIDVRKAIEKAVSEALSTIQPSLDRELLQEAFDLFGEDAEAQETGTDAWAWKERAHWHLQGLCPRPFPEDDGTQKDCNAKGHCGCVYNTRSATGASIPYRATIKFDHETREVSGTLDLPVDTTVTK